MKILHGVIGVAHIENHVRIDLEGCHLRESSTCV